MKTFKNILKNNDGVSPREILRSMIISCRIVLGMNGDFARWCQGFEAGSTYVLSMIQDGDEMYTLAEIEPKPSDEDRYFELIRLAGVYHGVVKLQQNLMKKFVKSFGPDGAKKRESLVNSALMDAIKLQKANIEVGEKGNGEDDEPQVSH